MSRALFLLAVIALYGCAAHIAQPVTPKPVVILGNKTEHAVCECPSVAAEHQRAESWKAYAEKLETQLGIPRGGQP